MELWIRSQDKSNLKKVNNIYVEKIEKDFDSWVGNIYSQPYVITSDNGNLGFYSTKERALEVLDDIQNFICIEIHKNNINYEEVDLILKGKIVDSLCKVYQMPKE